jgi:hypothetical protein
MQETGVSGVAHVIQLSVAPVFLLTGIGAILAVMINRLARIVDRARVLETADVKSGTDAGKTETDELHTLARRGKLISLSITLCTATALFVCAVIAVLFLGAFLNFETSTVSTLIALLFITAMTAFFLGLLLFLWEIFLAASTLRIGIQHISIPDSESTSEISRPKKGSKP